MILVRIVYPKDVEARLEAGELDRGLYPERVLLEHYPRKNDEFELADDTTMYVVRSSTHIGRSYAVTEKGSVTMFLAPAPLRPDELWP